MDDRVRLIQGDCLAILPTLAAGSVDAVVTDPPYNVGCPYASYDDRREPADYEAWCAEWFAECRRIASHRTIVFPGHGNLAMWQRIHKPSGIGCWYKPGNPASGGVFQFCEWEPWLLYGKGIGGSDVIKATLTEQRLVGGHPCPKPLSLMIQLTRRIKSATILDPFMGSGTTGVAALKAGHRFIGIEIDPGYFRVAQRRLAAAATPLFDGPAAAVPSGAGPRDGGGEG